MSPIKYFFLFAFLILAFLVALYISTTNSSNSELVNFYNKSPAEISNSKHLVLILGAVTRQGIYSISEDEKLANLIQSPDGLTEEADTDRLEAILNNTDLDNTPVVIIPFKNNSKLLVNYSSSSELAELLKITKDKADQITSKTPYLSLSEVDQELKKLGIAHNDSLLL